VYVSESSIHGKGVFSSIPLLKGQLILAIDDSRLVTPETPLRPDLGEFEIHCDYLQDGKTTLMMFPERHINHCCEPNSFVKTIREVRYVFAYHAIAGDEEITYDYCVNGFGDTLWECRCGSPFCRRQIHSDFFHLPIEKQIEYLPLLDDWYLHEYHEKVSELIQELMDQ
jgi:hypothetical protein